MVSINRILCAIDFSDFSLDALRHALMLSQWYSAQLTLFHAYQASQPLAVSEARGGIPVFVEADASKVADDVRRFCAPLIASFGQSVEVRMSLHEYLERLLAGMTVQAQGHYQVSRRSSSSRRSSRVRLKPDATSRAPSTPPPADRTSAARAA